VRAQSFHRLYWRNIESTARITIAARAGQPKDYAIEFHYRIAPGLATAPDEIPAMAAMLD
jgi:hypothetical protein